MHACQMRPPRVLMRGMQPPTTFTSVVLCNLLIGTLQGLVNMVRTVLPGRGTMRVVLAFRAYGKSARLRARDLFLASGLSELRFGGTVCLSSIYSSEDLLPGLSVAVGTGLVEVSRSASLVAVGE